MAGTLTRIARAHAPAPLPPTAGEPRAPTRRSPRGPRTRATLVCCALLLASVMCAGCVDDNPAFVEPLRCPDGQSLYQQSFPAVATDRIDVVILVENTPRSSALRQQLAQRAASILAPLDGLDFRVAVLPTDANGVLRRGGCLASSAAPWVDGDSRDAEATLGCLLAVEDSSMAGAPGLRSLARAVAEPIERNQGFIRRDARLMVLVVATVDDCSGLAVSSPDQCETSRAMLDPVEGLFQVIRTAKPDLNAVAIGALVGPEDGLDFSSVSPPVPACTSNLAEPWHGRRYRAFADLATHFGATESVCVNDVGPALESLATGLARSTESRYCLGREVSDGLRTVSLVRGADASELDEGVDGGWAFIGATDRCVTGELVVGAEARRTVSESTLVETFFCGP